MSSTDIDLMLKRLSNLIKQHYLEVEIINSSHIVFTLNNENTHNVIKALSDENDIKAIFLTMFASDERSVDGKYNLHIIFLLVNTKILLTFKVRLDQLKPSYPAISKLIPAAQWFEREIHDMFGIIAEEIDLPPLVLHRDFPRGKYFPMRKDFPLNKEIKISEVPHQFKLVNSDEVHQVAVGPIHAGIIEPGHLRFSTIGEHILEFDAQLFYTHKGLEKMAEGKTVDEGLVLAEHTCGMCSYSHSTAFCQAIESLSGVVVPERAIFIRTVFLELERLSSHLADLSSICSAGGFSIAGMKAAKFREDVMQLISRLVGHRFFRGVNLIGGLKNDVSNDSFNALIKDLQVLNRELHSLENMITGSDTLLDRLETTGSIDFVNATNIGIVGPSARASGVDLDLRRDFAYAAYSKFTPEVFIESDGDALARTKIRIKEIYETLKLIPEIVSQMPSGSVTGQKGDVVLFKPGIGIVESAKGSLVHCVILDEKQKIQRWHVRSASYMNWRGMVYATKGKNIVPDAPLVNKSFNLCYACVDR